MRSTSFSTVTLSPTAAIISSLASSNLGHTNSTCSGDSTSPAQAGHSGDGARLKRWRYSRKFPCPERNWVSQGFTSP
uniref:Putative secreted protein n=1 Tax=Anopheles triannulatus TaxID=58253 RepID=A0A2M4B5T8_9DIPT